VDHRMGLLFSAVSLGSDTKSSAFCTYERFSLAIEMSFSAQ
jgi:hypothetical protein